MGRPLFPISSPVGSVETSGQDNVEVASEQQRQGPRTWVQGDADPDQPSWWNQQKIYVEAFTANKSSAEPENQEPNSGRLIAASANEAGISPKEEQQINFDFSTLFPAKYTITEEELANVRLDTMEDISDDEFELAWDEEDNSEDMEFDVAAGVSAVSTPAPSTPVASARIVSLPISVPTTPRRRTTLPHSLSSTPIPIGTPARQNSYHAHSPSMSPMPTSSSMTTRSVARVRGFAVYSPRTELVL